MSINYVGMYCQCYALQTGFKHIFDSIKLKNNAAFERILKEAIELALGLCICTFDTTIVNC